jgi:hypothetical protein
VASLTSSGGVIVGGGFLPPASASASTAAHSTAAPPILTSLAQVEAQIAERAELWPADHRRQQARLGGGGHGRAHPTKAEAARRVAERRTRLMAENGVESIVPPVLSKLLLASLPQSARTPNRHHSGGDDAAAAGNAHGNAMADDGAAHVNGAAASHTTRSEVAAAKRAFHQQQGGYADAGIATPRGSTVPRAHRPGGDNDAAAAAVGDPAEMMARYAPTADGWAARVLCLREPKLGVWRRLSVTEKQHIVAFEQRENRFHHAHGVNNMKLAGLNLKRRRAARIGIDVAPSDAIAHAEALERKRLLEQQRHTDVRQTALMLRAWMPRIPERFADDPAAAVMS